MDHETALKLMACEAYLLGELPEKDRDEFEEHFFSCAACADDLRAAAAMAANMKSVLRENNFRSERRLLAPGLLVTSPAFTISAALNVCLLGALGLMAWKIVEGARSQLSGPQFFQAVVVPALSRDAAPPPDVSCPALCGFTFELNPDQKFQSYSYEVLGQNGSRPLSGSLAVPADSETELHFALPAAPLKPGRYWLVMRGVTGTVASEVGRIPFTH